MLAVSHHHSAVIFQGCNPEITHRRPTERLSVGSQANPERKHNLGLKLPGKLKPSFTFGMVLRTLECTHSVTGQSCLNTKVFSTCREYS